MKKFLSILLAAAMFILPAYAVFADEAVEEVPQPEAGKKFDTDWALFGMTVSIVYEEEGYRVDIRGYEPADGSGAVWEYACWYNEEKDVLESVVSMKYTFSLNMETGEEVIGDFEYDDFDEENQVTVFAVNENGKLTWKDGRGQDGADLEFTNIGRFDGTWVDQDQKVWVEITWSDDENDYGYEVLVHTEGDGSIPDVPMKGLSIVETGKLECLDSEAFAEWFDNGPENMEDPAECLHFMENGNLFLESMELELVNYDLLPDESDNG